MQRLNIPLSRHRKTTRRNRWVVWMITFVVVLGLFVLWRGSVRWFTRASLFEAAPSDTIFALQLNVNERTQQLISNTLGTVPLISERSITIDDILPYTHGDLAIFITQNGERSVAIRSSAQELPQTLFDSYGIAHQQLGDIVLLSQTLVPISGIESSGGSVPIFPTFRRMWIGRIELPETQMAAGIFLDDQTTTLRFNKGSVESGSINLPESTIDLITTSLSEKTRSILLKTFQLPGNTFTKGEFSSLLDVLFSPNTEIAIATQDAKTSFLIRTSAQEEIDPESFLKIIGATANPYTKTIILIDGTSYEELVVDPSLVSVEEISVSGNKSLRVRLADNDYIYAISTDDAFVLSNSDTMIDAFFNPSDLQNECAGSKLSIQPKNLINNIRVESYDMTIGWISTLLDDISQVSVETNKYSSDVTLCRL